MTSKLTRLIAALLALALVAAACGGGDSDDASTGGGDSSSQDSEVESGDDDSGGDGDLGGDVSEAGADETATGEDQVTEEGVVAQSGGTLRIGMEAEPDSLNPNNTPLAVTGVMMTQAIFDTLTAWDENGEWTNNMSESWTPNEDGSSWEMKLRPGITFTDGLPLDADAVIKNLNAKLADPILGVFFGPTFDLDNTVEKIDDLTVRINANGPNNVIPAYFATQLGMIGSPAWVDAAAEDPGLDQAPIGAGPFKLESRTQDFQTRLVRNDGWYRTDQEVYLDAIEFYPLQQESSRTDQLLSGDLEIASVSDQDSIVRMRDAADISRIEDDAGEEFNLLFNAGQPPMDDIRVRQAATHAFPTAVYGDLILRGVTRPANGFFAPGSIWHVPEITQPTDMPELAGPLIEAYCADFPENCTDGKVDIEYQHNGPSLALDQIADVIGSAWEPFFNITIQVIPQDQHVNEVIFGLYDVATWRYHGFLDPDLEVGFWSCDSIGGLSVNFTRHCDPARDELFRAQRETDDLDERIDIWRDIQFNMRDSFNYLNISHLNWTIGAGPNVNGLCDAVNADGETLRCVVNGRWWLPQIWLSQ